MKELGLKARASKKPINLENQKKKFYFILIEDHNTQVTSLKRN
jgi:hypothetical protein